MELKAGQGDAAVTRAHHRELQHPCKRRRPLSSQQRTDLRPRAATTIPSESAAISGKNGVSSREHLVYEGGELNETALKALIRSGVEHNPAKVKAKTRG